MLLWKKLQLSVSSPEARLEAIRQLAQSKDPSAVDLLIEALKDRDGKVPVVAAQALAYLGNPKAVPALVVLLRDKEEYLRVAASDALGKLGAPAINPVVALLRDPDPKVREQAAATLGQIGVAALGPLSSSLRSPDRHLRAAVAEALGHINHSRSVDFLLGTLKDRESTVADKAARALIQIGKTAVPGLLNLLNDPENELRQRALFILQKLGVEPMTETYLRPVAYGKWKDVAGVGSQAMDALEAELKSAERSKRYTAVLTLANICDARAVPGLTTALVDADREIRETATKALVKTKAPAVEPLLATLKKGRAELRAKAAAVLGYIGDDRARDPLVAALADQDPGVRGAAAEALIAFKDGRTVDPLLALLNDPHAQVRFSAVGALWQIRDPRAIDGLTGALRDKDSATRKRAVQALGDIGTEWVITFLVRLFQEDKGARLETALAVAKIRPPRSVQLLLTVAAEEPIDAEEAIAILADVLEVSAAKIVTEDLQAVANLPGTLSAGQGALKRPDVLAKPIDTSVVRQRAAAELARRGSRPRAAGTAAP